MQLIEDVQTSSSEDQEVSVLNQQASSFHSVIRNTAVCDRGN